MPVQKKWHGLSCLAACLLLLPGCGGKLLSEREIARAVFFTQTKEGCQATLLLQDSSGGQSGAGDGKPSYKNAVGQGDSPAQALHKAEGTLDGEVFYGLLDTAALPPDSDWQTATEIGELLYQKAQPSPQISVYLLGEQEARSLQQRAGEIYDAVAAALKSYAPQCGLEQLFAQSDQCAVPVWQEDGYSFAFLRQGESPVLTRQPLQAQLAAVLCGQTDTLRCDILQGSAALQAQACAEYQPVAADTLLVHLRLKSINLTPLGNEQTAVGEQQLRDALRLELQQQFSSLINAVQQIAADPFRLAFWQGCEYGGGAPKKCLLEIQFEE